MDYNQKAQQVQILKDGKVVSYFSPEMKGNEGNMNTEWLQKWIDRRTKTHSETDAKEKKTEKSSIYEVYNKKATEDAKTEAPVKKVEETTNPKETKKDLSTNEIKNKIKAEKGLKFSVKETTDGKCRIDVSYDTEDHSWYSYSMAADYLTIDPKDFGKRDFHWENVAFRTHTNLFGQGTHYLPLLEQNYDITLSKDGKLTTKKSEK